MSALTRWLPDADRIGIDLVRRARAFGARFGPPSIAADLRWLLAALVVLGAPPAMLGVAALFVLFDARPDAAIALALGAALLIVLTAALCLVVARRITTLVARAGEAAARVADARRPRLGPPDIQQFGPLFDALNDAGERVVSALERERRARTLAEDADRGKDRFLLMLGHELRNPLAAAANAAHLLRRRDLAPGQRDRVVELLQRQQRQLRRLVDDLLVLGGLLTGTLVLQREPVAVDRLLRESIAAAGAAGQLSAHSLRVELEPLHFALDAARFEQVFANLLANAIRCTPAGGTITVRLLHDGGGLALTVADTGIGIAASQLERIFAPFVQGPPRDGSAPAGLGVGLPLARMLVDAHGGHIAAHSDGPQRGATFVVTIPGRPTND